VSTLGAFDASLLGAFEESTLHARVGGIAEPPCCDNCSCNLRTYGATAECYYGFPPSRSTHVYAYGYAFQCDYSPGISASDSEFLGKTLRGATTDSQITMLPMDDIGGGTWSNFTCPDWLDETHTIKVTRTGGLVTRVRYTVLSGTDYGFSLGEKICGWRCE
jgi:hypothetical protein